MRAMFARNAVSSPLVVYSVARFPFARLPRSSAVRSACMIAGSISVMPSPRTAQSAIPAPDSACDRDENVEIERQVPANLGDRGARKFAFDRPGFDERDSAPAPEPR